MVYILLKVLPRDIVEYIYNINKWRNASNIIMKHYNNIIYKHDILNCIVKMISNDTYEFNDINYDLQYNLYNYLQIIINSEFNREKYNHYFWQSFLHMLSKMLMYFYNTLGIRNKLVNNNIYYKNLKKSITLWFKLCTKHNIKLALMFNSTNLSKSIDEFIYFRARNILKINNFNRFKYSPYVLDNDEFVIEKNFAINYLKQITGLD